MKRYIWVVVLLAFLVSYGITASPTATAFTKSWRALCTHVESSQRGLWDDMPGAGVDNEAALFWVITDSSDNEYCEYSSDFQELVSTTTFPTLQVRFALNDGAKFKVEVFEFGAEFCDRRLTAFATTSSEDHNGWLTKQVTLPAGHDICRVQITLDDDPDSLHSGRIKALIDYIRIWNDTNFGWAETFTGGNL